MSSVLAPDFVPLSGGKALSTSPDRWGQLIASDPGEPVEVLRQRFLDEGYLYLKGFFAREVVAGVRRSLLSEMEAGGKLLEGSDPALALPRPGARSYMDEEVALRNQPLKELVAGERIFAFYRTFFGEEVRGFDYTWLRAVSPGLGTNPHCDTVYMGRGTKQLMTAWIPLGDVPLRLGGLIVLEKSHVDGKVDPAYLGADVDRVCSNRPGVNEVEALGYLGSGALTGDAPALRDQLGGRWLTSEFEMGDLVTFGMTTVHGSLDNQSESLRLSSDTRYQPASLPVDERWVGEDMPMHGPAGKRDKIC